MIFAASTPAFDRALSVEIAASEQIRMRVLAGALAILFLGDQLLFLFARETLEQFAGRLLPTWLLLKVFGPLAGPTEGGGKADPAVDGGRISEPRRAARGSLPD